MGNEDETKCLREPNNFCLKNCLWRKMTTEDRNGKTAQAARDIAPAIRAGVMDVTSTSTAYGDRIREAILEGGNVNCPR